MLMPISALKIYDMTCLITVYEKMNKKLCNCVLQLCFAFVIIVVVVVFVATRGGDTTTLAPTSSKNQQNSSSSLINDTTIPTVPSNITTSSATTTGLVNTNCANVFDCRTFTKYMSVNLLELQMRRDCVNLFRFFNSNWTLALTSRMKTVLNKV